MWSTLTCLVAELPCLSLIFCVSPSGWRQQTAKRPEGVPGGSERCHTHTSSCRYIYTHIHTHTLHVPSLTFDLKSCIYAYLNLQWCSFNVEYVCLPSAMHESSRNVQACLADMYEPDWYGNNEVESIVEVRNTFNECGKKCIKSMKTSCFSFWSQS